MEMEIEIIDNVKPEPDAEYIYAHAPISGRTGCVFLIRECPQLLRAVKGLAIEKAHDRMMKMIISRAYSAEMQYQLLMQFYKNCMGYEPPKKHGYRYLSPEEERIIVEMRRAGHSKLSIARELGRHVSTIYYACKRLKV